MNFPSAFSCVESARTIDTQSQLLSFVRTLCGKFKRNFQRHLPMVKILHCKVEKSELCTKIPRIGIRFAVDLFVIWFPLMNFVNGWQFESEVFVKTQTLQRLTQLGQGGVVKSARKSLEIESRANSSYEKFSQLKTLKCWSNWIVNAIFSTTEVSTSRSKLNRIYFHRV